jgi:hypothetical protein
MGALAATAAGCGSSGSSGSASTSVSGVQSCLQSAGYGVTLVPTSQLTTGGPENRGPGQTGELLVARGGAKPAIGSESTDVVVAFWKSAKLAKDSPNSKAKALGMHADTLGSVTVQPTTTLVAYAFKVAKTPAAREAAYLAQVKKIEGCVS